MKLVVGFLAGVKKSSPGLEGLRLFDEGQELFARYDDPRDYKSIELSFAQISRNVHCEADASRSDILDRCKSFGECIPDAIRIGEAWQNFVSQDGSLRVCFPRSIERTRVPFPLEIVETVNAASRRAGGFLSSSSSLIGSSRACCSARAAMRPSRNAARKS
ncbi:MAG: hypothetical protein WBB98_13335 [Xanthobacteraceae bacterium]